MAISKLLRILSGLVQTVDLAAEELQVLSITVGGASGTNLTKTALDSLISNSHASGSDNQNVTAGDGLTGGGSGASPTLAVGAGNGIAVSADAVAVDYDDSTIGLNGSSKLAVKDGGIANTQVSGTAAIALSKLAALTASRALVSDGSGVISASSVTSTELGYLTGVTSAVQTQINNLSSLIQNFEWAESALDYIVDNTAAPPTEVSGDRYVLSADGGTPHANWDGAEAGDIVEFNGTIWVETDPVIGMMISIDDESSSLRQWSGSAWVQKYFESTTASTGLTKVGFDIRLDSSSAGDGLGFSSGVLSVNVDNSSIEKNADALRVKASGITNDMLAGSIADSKLSQITTADKVAGSAVQLNSTGGIVNSTGLALNVDNSTVEVTGAGILQVKDSGIVNAKIPDAEITLAKLASADTAGKFIVANGSGVPTYVAMSGDAVLSSDGSISIVSAGAASSVKVLLSAQESLTLNTSFLLRFAVSGETAGGVYKATNAAAATDGKFYAVGIATGLGSTGNHEVTTQGLYELGSADTAFGSGDIGKPVYLTTAGGFSVTPPSASGTAVYRVGVVSDTTHIFVGNMQLNGIN